MNTPAHLLFGVAAFGKPGRPGVTAAAFAGSLLPDLSLYVLAGTSLFILGIDPQVVFSELYFSPSWQAIFSIDNSAVLWGAGLLLALFLQKPWAIALCGAALLHISLDFLLHHDDGRPHFWPLSDWVFQSPVSYWDPAHFGRIVGPIELILSLMAAVFIWRRWVVLSVRLPVIALGVLQTAPAVMWVFVFG